MEISIYQKYSALVRPRPRLPWVFFRTANVIQMTQESIQPTAPSVFYCLCLKVSVRALCAHECASNSLDTKLGRCN